MPVATRASEENQVGRDHTKGVIQQQQQQAGKRKALGDISSNATSSSRGQAKGAKVAKHEHAASQPTGAPNRRVTRSQAKALQASTSLSALLQARSQATARHQQQQQPNRPSTPLPDIDPDHENPLAVAAYVNDIYSFYRRVEPRFRVPHDYMSSQRDVNIKMRGILIDWLVEVHLKFKLMPETLFLACALIDRYLAAAQVARKNLQLVGVTAMLIAAKYEETWAPEVHDFVYISDNAYDRQQLLDMERSMLKALGYELTMPTSYQYLARLLKAANVHYNKPLALFVAYCAELTLVDYGCLRFSSSELAAAIMYVALKAFGKQDAYPHALAAHAGKRREEVLHVAKEVVRLVQRAPDSGLQAVRKKYSTPKFEEAASVRPPLDILDE